MAKHERPSGRSLFTSALERRFWVGALASVLAIYATLGLAGSLSQELRNRNLLDATFLAAFLLLMAAIAGNGLVKRTTWRAMWSSLGVITVYGMVLIRVFVSAEERTHLIEYGVVATLVYRALAERVKNGGRVHHPAVLAVVVTAGVGWCDEGIQAMLPNRVYDLRDVGFNTLAAGMAIAATLLLDRIRDMPTRS